MRRFLSVCSGIEAASVAWGPLGWKAAAFSEIEPFPRAVLQHHYSDVPLFGDFTQISAEDLRAIGPISVLCGGTPCQSFSVAGLRKGLDDPRGNLALAFLRLAELARPRWVVWENVPGVLSSSGGRDLGAFLGALGQLGYGYAGRVLDAQYVRVDGYGRAVPQRRRRVFVVGCLGDWRGAAAVLLERESLSGNPPPRRTQGKGVAGTLAPGAHPGGFNGQDAYTNHLVATEGVAGTLGTHHGIEAQQAWTGRLVAHTLRGDGFDASEDGTGRGTPLIVTQDSCPVVMEGVSPALKIGTGLEMGQPPCVLAFSSKDYGGDAGEVAPTLRSMSHDRSHANGGGQVAVAFDWKQGSDPTSSMPVTEEVTGTLGATREPAIQRGMAVRRLTPRECERLQGFPDDWTLIPWRGKPASECPDGPRYRALGNSWACNVARWIGRRIDMVDAISLATQEEAA
jgi:DNA (cytosine-5)-methyltransferase 1